MHEGIDRAVGDLARGQGEGLDRIQNREAREHQRAGEAELGLQRLAGDDGEAVHFRAGGGQGQHAAHRQGLVDVLATGLEDVPRFAGVVHRRGDELGAVDDRTTADGEQEVELLAADLLDRAHQGLVGRVGFDAAEALHGTCAERGLDLGQGAVTFGAAAAVQHQHAGVGGHEFVEARDAVLAEDDAGGVVVVEVQHVSSCCRLVCGLWDEKIRPVV